MSIEVKVGDVFLIPLDEHHWAGGQVAGDWEGELYLAIFEERYARDDADAVAIVDGTPAFFLLSMDAKFWHGHWPILENLQYNLGEYPQPAFKVGLNGVMHVESRDRTIFRPASAREVEMLQYRTVSSAAEVEAAVQAYFGIGEWESRYDELTADYAIRSSKIL
jgi:immunity protein 26 of polymorphic toxin system